MKVKKQKRHRRAVRFFTAAFGFHQPYKVFCDGTFVHHLIANRIVPADIALSNILGGPVKLFTSRCVLEELKRLGPSYSQDIEAAHNLMTARCDHEGIKSAEACLTDLVGKNNPEHFFIATQDADLRNKFQEVLQAGMLAELFCNVTYDFDESLGMFNGFRSTEYLVILQVPGVPLIFGLRNSLFIEKPSSFQHEFVKASEVNRSILSERERDMLKKETGNIIEAAERGTSVDEHEGPGRDLQSKRYVRNGLNVKDRPQFKRKKPKGPNPLSCRKKKSAKPKASVAKESKAANNSEAETSRRTRRRKRPTTGEKKMLW
ncbi:rRNA-processing protein UTP23 homolog [Linum grandiflorum]